VKTLLTVLTLWLIASPAWSEPVTTWPTESWAMTSPESMGFDSAKLAAALSEIKARKLNIHSLTLIRHGKVLLDTTFYPYDGRRPHNLASVTKSVMTTLIAIAADQGKLDLDQPMLVFFPNRFIANRDDRKRRITVRQLTGMSSGLDCVGEYDEPTLHQMNASPDWVQFTLDLKMVAEPGSVFSYCSPGMHLLSAILQQATGVTTLDFARANLFEPLGIDDVIWPVDPQGVNHGWGDLYLYPKDAAKIGLLWLQGGQWNGQQIVPRKWVEQSSRLQIKTKPPWSDDYGFGWWIMTGDAVPQFAASGRGGQRIGVFPTLDAIAVTTGAGLNPGKALDLVGGALADRSLPENADGTTKLRIAIEAMSEPPSPVAPKPLPPIAIMVSGKKYQLEPNPLALKTIRLDFDASTEATLSMTFSDGQPPRSGAIGLDGVYRFSKGDNGLPTGIRGRWADADTFISEYDAIANLDAFDLKMRFTANKITIDAKERTYESGVTLTGTSDEK
jgi:CubicO group peptidase (beta-lactamase class C family)